MKLRIAIIGLWICTITIFLATAVCAFVPVYDGTTLRQYHDTTFEDYRIGPHDIHTPPRPKEAKLLSQDLGRLPTVPEILTRFLYYGLPAVTAVVAIVLATFSVARLL
jgi:hypothetical protein